MTLVMAYALLLSSVVAAGAALCDLLVSPRRVPARWTWLSALILLVPITTFVMVAPPNDDVVTESPPGATIGGNASLSESLAADVPATGYLERADVVLSAGWALVSLVLLLAIAVGRWRVVRARRRAQRVELQGQQVLLTADLGPAVAGVRNPVVFIPRWVVTLDDASQRLLLEHELEHVRRGDTRVLMAGAVLTALVPWNPVAWWIARRLRIAVELDCDRRVLATHPGVRRYADLLLIAAGKPDFTTRFLAAHFGEHASDLERRIDAMTNVKWHWRPTVAAAIATSALIVAACEAPRPEPVAPMNLEGAKVSPDRVAASDVLYEFQVEKPVSLAAGSTMPKYPKILREAGVEGEVLASFVVDESGQAAESSLKILRSTHELFAQALREALPGMRFTPAEVGGRKMKQLVQQPFTFTIAGTKSSVSSESYKKFASAEIVVTGVPGEMRSKSRTSSSSPVEMVEIPVDGGSQEKRAAFIVRRGDQSATTPPNIVVYSFDGKELARQEGEGNLLEKIAPQTIHSIEVFKPTSCGATAACPLIKITLAKGRTLPR